MRAMRIPKEIKSLVNYPVALFGSGVSGRAVMDILSYHNLSFLCFDEHGDENDRHFFNSSDAREHPLVIYRPGFAQDHPWLQTARGEGFSENILKDAVVRFPTRRHRLEKVLEITNISFWNDSKATNFAATYAALKAFDQPVIWIGGGQSKGGEIKEFARKVAGKVKMAYLIGETAEEMANGLKEENKPVDRCETMQEAVFSAFEKAEPHDIILLSPGFSSIDMYKNYDQRGSSFEHAVLSLKNHLTQNNIT